MTDSWRQADAQAHEAKADAIDAAVTAIVAVRAFIPSPLGLLLDQAVTGLQHEHDAHEQRAKLVAAP